MYTVLAPYLTTGSPEAAEILLGQFLLFKIPISISSEILEDSVFSSQEKL